MSKEMILTAGLVTFGITFIALYVWELPLAPLVIVPAVFLGLTLGRWTR